MAQRIVIPIDDNTGMESKIAPHFGRASYFAIIEMSGRGQITNLEIKRNTAEQVGSIGNPFENLLSLQPSVIITCELGIGGLYSFQEAGIKVFKAKGNTVNEVITNFRAGKLYPLKIDCLHISSNNLEH